MSEAIDVISVFRKGAVKPLKFRYAGRTHVISKVLYRWITREGSYPVHHFSVETGDGDHFELSLNTYTMDWAICTVDLSATG